MVYNCGKIFLKSLVLIIGWSLCISAFSLCEEELTIDTLYQENIPPYLFISNMCVSTRFTQFPDGVAKISLKLNSLLPTYEFNRPGVPVDDPEINYCLRFFSNLPEHNCLPEFAVEACLFHQKRDIPSFFSSFQDSYWETEYVQKSCFPQSERKFYNLPQFRYEITSDRINLEVPLRNISSIDNWSFNFIGYDSHNNPSFFGTTLFSSTFVLDTLGSPSCSGIGTNTCFTFSPTPNPSISTQNCPPSFIQPGPLLTPLELCREYNFPTFSAPNGCGNILSVASTVTIPTNNSSSIEYAIELERFLDSPMNPPLFYSKCYLNLFLNQNVLSGTPSFQFHKRPGFPWSIVPTGNNFFWINQVQIFQDDKLYIKIVLNGNPNPFQIVSRYGIEAIELSPNNSAIWASGICANPPPSFSSSETCSVLQICPVDCGYAVCAQGAALCPENQCDDANPFPCFNSEEIVCESSPFSCKSLYPVTENCTTELCWDNRCRPIGIPFCPDVPSCPPFTKRCWDGRCLNVNENCGEDSGCLGQIRCPTGECVGQLRDCPAWNGCPPPNNPNLRITCPDGRCVANGTFCRCDDGKFRCFDRTCRDNPTDCPRPPAAIKLLPVSWNLALNQQRTLGVVAQGSKQPLLRIQIPEGALSSLKRNCPTQVVAMGCAAVSDSKLREYRLPTWDPDTESFENYFSPAWDLTIDDCIPRPFPENITFTLTIQYSGDKNDLALLFLNQGETTEWQIGDQNLEIIDYENGTLFITARTNHFTSFVIGFSKSSKEGEEKKSELNLGLVIGVAITALFLIAALSVLIIVLKKKQAEKKKRFAEEELELKQSSTNIKYQFLRSHLEELELLQYLPIFVKNEITYDNLITFEQEQLVELGLPLGAAKKIYTSYSSLREKKYLNTNDIQIGERLGGGAYGEVYRGTYLASNVALKKLHDSAQTQEFLAESKLLQKLRHPNVVIFFGIYKSPEGEQYMVSELLSLGSLKHLLKEKSTSLETYELVHMAVMTAAGMSYLAENNIVHCDLATRNLLVKLEDDEYLVKVADFGLSKHNINSEITSSKDTKYPVKWTAPEAFGGVFTTKSDIWSFGVVLYEIFTFGGEPYPEMGNKEVFEKVKEGYRMAQPLGCPDSIYKVMLNCWAEDPKKRPEFSLLYEQLSLLQKEEFPLKKNEGKETTIPINESKPPKKTTEDTYSVTPADQSKKEEPRYTNDLN